MTFNKTTSKKKENQNEDQIQPSQLNSNKSVKSIKSNETNYENQSNSEEINPFHLLGKSSHPKIKEELEIEVSNEIKHEGKDSINDSNDSKNSNFHIKNYIFYDKSLNLNTILKISLPKHYFNQHFLYHSSFDSNKISKNDLKESVFYSVINVFYKEYNNSEVLLLYQIGGNYNDFIKDSEDFFFKEISNAFSQTNKEIEENEIFECDFEKDCQNQSKIQDEPDEKLKNNEEVFDSIDINVDLDENLNKDLINENTYVYYRLNSDKLYKFNVNQYKNQENHEKTEKTKRKSSFNSNFIITSNILMRISDYSSIINDSNSVNEAEITCLERRISLKSDFFNKKAKEAKETNVKNKSNSQIPIILNISFSIINNTKTDKTGLINEAMTCYMNSMLQTLYSISFFRQAVYNVIDIKKESCIYGLQRVFYDLETLKKPVSTTHLIKSFGWNDNEIMVQHDIQEFNLILSESLENKMKGTPSEGTFKELFEGKIVNYIRCIDVKYESKREETFTDISIQVKNCKDIYSALDKYTEIELLNKENENQYEAEGFGKQNAEKGVKFKSLPPVMLFQLKRFEMNFYTDSFEKVNDRFEYYDDINMRKYSDDNENTEELVSEEYDYCLHSVVVHSGTINYGHYYCYIKDWNYELGGRWVKFNDETVRIVNKTEVFDWNFGGSDVNFYVNSENNVQSKEIIRESSAYFLVYIKKSLINKLIFNNGNEIFIEKHIKSYILDDINNERKERFDDYLLRNNIDIYLTDFNLINDHEEIGILPSISDINQGDSLFDDTSKWLMLSFPLNYTINDMIKVISIETRLDESRIEVFKYDYMILKDVRKRNYFKSTFISDKTQKISTVISNNRRKKLVFYIFYDDFQEGFDKQCYQSSQSSNNSQFPIRFIEKIGEIEEKPEIDTVIPMKTYGIDCLNEGETKKQSSKKGNDMNSSNSYKMKLRKRGNNIQKEEFEDSVVIKSNNKNRFYVNNQRKSLEIKKENTENTENSEKKLVFLKVPFFNLENKVIGFRIEKEIVIKQRNCSSSNNNLDNKEYSMILSYIKTYFNKRISENSRFSKEIPSNPMLEIKIHQEIIENSIQTQPNNIIERNDIELYSIISNFNKETIKEEVTPSTNDFIILLPSTNLTYSSIDEYYKTKFNEVFLYSFFKRKRNSFKINSKKIKYDYRFNQNEIIKTFYKHIQSEGLLNYKENKQILSFFSHYHDHNITEKENVFIINTKANLIQFDVFFNEEFDEENIHLKPNLDYVQSLNQVNSNENTGSKPSLTSASSLNPNLNTNLGDFIYNKAYLLFSFKFYKRNQLNFITRDIIFFDAYSNPLLYTHSLIPKEKTLLSEYLTYLRDILIKLGLISSSLSSPFHLYNIKLILQEIDGKIAYEIVTDLKTDLEQYRINRNYIFTYRLQPYSSSEISKMNSLQYQKVFLSFRTRDNKFCCNPVITFIPKEFKVVELKGLIRKLLENISLAREYQSKDIKLYTFNFSDGQIRKENLLIDSRDSNEVKTYFKNMVWNVLVEFPALERNYKEGDLTIN